MANKLSNPGDNMKSESSLEMNIQKIFLFADFIDIVVEDISGEVESGRDKSRYEVDLDVANEDNHQKNKVEIKRKQLSSKEIDFESLVLNQSKEGNDNLRNTDEVDNFVPRTLKSSKLRKRTTLWCDDDYHKQ